MKVLFVCKANVGRSQMAEAFFNNYTRNHKSTSAGTEVKDKEGQTIGQNEKARFVWEVMDEEGIDVRNYKRKQLTSQMVERADQVIVITEKEFCPDYLLKSPKAIYWEIPDAKGTDYETHVKTRDDIKTLVRGLIKKLD